MNELNDIEPVNVWQIVNQMTSNLSEQLAK